MISVIVPAFNEEAWLAATLDSIRASADHLRRWRPAWGGWYSRLVR